MPRSGRPAGVQPACLRAAAPANRKRDEILAFIADRAACPDLTPERIARQTGVSRTVLYQILKSFGGVATVVRQQRLRVMSRALADRGDARLLKAIAHDSGFRSLSHATRLFHETFGMTPGAFRQTGFGEPGSLADARRSSGPAPDRPGCG